MAGLLRILSVLSPVHIWFFTLLRGGRPVGADPYGNSYYETSARKGYNHTRRWVVYRGEPEASKVPPEWHGWLHHQTDVVPSPDSSPFRKSWIKPHRPNMTGTGLAHRPAGHPLEGGKREKATGDYHAWMPPSEHPGQTASGSKTER